MSVVSVVKVGTMCSPSEEVYEFLGSSVVQSKDW